LACFKSARFLSLAALMLPALGCTTLQLGEVGEIPLAQVALPLAELEDQAVKVMQPSNYRNWSPDQALLPSAEFEGDRVTVRNIRNCKYLPDGSYVVGHYDKTFDLNRLSSVDFIVVPFPPAPALAHTMLSFGFEDREYLAVSVEVRKEKGESYDVLKGTMRQYELMYVVGDERDLIKLRTNCRGDDVYLYRTRASRQQVRDLFVDIIERVNQLTVEPEFYDTLTNNCTTSIMRHVNRLVPDRVPYDPRVIFSGYSDRLAYDLGLLDTDLSFAETKRRARINELARRYADSPDFSARIRQGSSPVTAEKANPLR